MTLPKLSIILFNGLVEAARCWLPDGTACRKADKDEVAVSDRHEDPLGAVGRVAGSGLDELLRSGAARPRGAVLVATEALVGHERRAVVDADQHERRHERRHGDDHHARTDDPAEHAEREPFLRSGDDVADGAQGEQPGRAGGEDALTQGEEGVAAALGSDEAEERARIAHCPAGVDRLERAGEGEQSDDEHCVGDLVVNGHGRLLGTYV